MGRRFVTIRELMELQKRHGTVPSRRLRPGRLVLVPGRRAGGPHELSGSVIDVLVDCERAGAATVLLAADVGDLETPVAAVCRIVAADRAEVLDAARERFGDERVHAVEMLDPAHARIWIGPLEGASRQPARPVSRGGRRADWIKPLWAVYERMRRRGKNPDRGRSPTRHA